MPKIKNTVPDNIIDKKLYREIRDKMREDHKKSGKRWGAYSSALLQRYYKNKNGRYKTKKNHKTNKGLSRWFKEQWVNVCKWPKRSPCGRSDMKSKFPYCRPLKKITKNTPKTVLEITPKQRNAMCSKKRRNPDKVIFI